jgi:hypothetical protein
MTTNTQCWISSSDGDSGAVTVPVQGALLAVISQRRRGHFQSRTTPRRGTSQ